MEALNTFSSSSLRLSMIPTKPPKNQCRTPMFYLPFHRRPNSSLSSICINKPKFKIFSSSFPTISTEATDSPAPEVEIQGEEDKFNWFSHWYPVAPVCDLDKRVPHAKRVMGLDIVVWWDRIEGKWQVFDDSCPHRRAPLSEGRIDQWGRLQCVYHGWCFNGAGDCKFIPQAPQEGPPVHTFKKACAGVYPSCEQNKIVWFWPSTEPQYKDVANKEKPPYIPELDDPSFSSSMGMRDFPFGYEVLVENLIDAAHTPYAHYGILPNAGTSKADREGGMPMEINVQTLDIHGFFAKQETGYTKFIPPCISYIFQTFGSDNRSASSESSTVVQQRPMLMVFFCIPVSPGKSRLIWTFPRNFGVWIDRVVPRWMFHVIDNLVLDSDMYLLYLEERKLIDAGPSNWHKACFTPTESDAIVIALRKWLRKYSGGQVDWGDKCINSGPLLGSPSKEQIMDRYSSHVVNCSSCRVANKGLKWLEVALQFISVATIGIVAAIKHDAMTMTGRTALVFLAVLCFVASRWLSHFIYKNFYFHDYNHSLV